MGTQIGVDDPVVGPLRVGSKRYRWWCWILVGLVALLPVGAASVWALVSYDLDPEGPGAGLLIGVAGLSAAALISIPVPPLVARMVLVDPAGTVMVKRLGRPPRPLDRVSHIEVVEAGVDVTRRDRSPHPCVDDSGESRCRGRTYRFTAVLVAHHRHANWGRRRSTRLANLAGADWPDRFTLAGLIAGPLDAGVTARRSYVTSGGQPEVRSLPSA